MEHLVDDIEATFAKPSSLGAKEYEAIRSRGDAANVTASVVYPCGNVLGIMHNPHYLQMLRSGSRRSRARKP